MYVHYLNKPIRIEINNLLLHTHFKHFNILVFHLYIRGKLKKLYKNGIFKFPTALSLAILN